jgi:hypothetical protein
MARQMNDLVVASQLVHLNDCPNTRHRQTHPTPCNPQCLPAPPEPLVPTANLSFDTDRSSDDAECVRRLRCQLATTGHPTILLKLHQGSIDLLQVDLIRSSPTHLLEQDHHHRLVEACPARRAEFLLSLRAGDSVWSSHSRVVLSPKFCSSETSAPNSSSAAGLDFKIDTCCMLERVGRLQFSDIGLSKFSVTDKPGPRDDSSASLATNPLNTQPKQVSFRPTAPPEPSPTFPQAPQKNTILNHLNSCFLVITST